MKETLPSFPPPLPSLPSFFTPFGRGSSLLIKTKRKKQQQQCGGDEERRRRRRRRGGGEGLEEQDLSLSARAEGVEVKEEEEGRKAN